MCCCFGQRLAADVRYCVGQRFAAFSNDNCFPLNFESGLPLTYESTHAMCCICQRIVRFSCAPALVLVSGLLASNVSHRNLKTQKHSKTSRTHLEHVSRTMCSRCFRIRKHLETMSKTMCSRCVRIQTHLEHMVFHMCSSVF